MCIARPLAGAAEFGARTAALRRLAEDPDRHVRSSAAQALGQIGGEETVDALLAMASDPQPRRRVEALGAAVALLSADLGLLDTL